MSKLQKRIGISVLAGVLSISSLLPVIPDKDNRHYRFSVSNSRVGDFAIIPFFSGGGVIPSNGDYKHVMFDVVENGSGFDEWVYGGFNIMRGSFEWDFWHNVNDGDIIDQRNQLHYSPLGYVLNKFGFEDTALSLSKKVNLTRVVDNF